jgi:hypothetical protein
MSHIGTSLQQSAYSKSFSKAKNYRSIADARITKDARFNQDFAEDFQKSESQLYHEMQHLTSFERER